MLKSMDDSFSNAIQLSPGTVYLVNDLPGEEIEKLAAHHLGKSLRS
jgi:hypothetical protein